MIRLWAILLCLLSLLSLPTASFAQARPSFSAKLHGGSPNAGASAKPTSGDYSKESFVFERYITTARFENDATSERNLSVRIRVQNEEGARQLHELIFPFHAANEQIDVRYVRVIKPDGTVVNGGADAVKEMTATVALDAPAYADCKEKHISVPPLVAGDKIEYSISTRLVKPFAPGEFWFAYNFVRSAIVLAESLEIDSPENRKLILKSAASVPYETEHSNGRTLYRWQHTNLKSSRDESSRSASQQAGTNPPDVELTTFTDWNGVARWYAKLAQGRNEPTPEIRAKAEELTRGESQTTAKIQVLYDYVSTNIRSVDLPLGRGSWAPHAAGEVLSNQYGDSADKHVLLAAMLKAVGISADVALIPYTRKLDASVPSPAQLDHEITAVPLGTGLIWMDTSTEVAPFQLLASPLRNKSALLVPEDGAGRIVKTPADPPFVSTQNVDIDGRVSDLGKLSARAHYAMRGDTELALRLAFHRTPPVQWNELAQTILSLDGMHGEVIAAKPSDPLATRDPFELDVDFTQSDFWDWSSKRAATPLPLLVIGMPDPPVNAAQPIELGSPLNVSVKLKLRLPPAYSAQPPVSGSIARDYAEFRSSYGFADHVLTAERSLDFKLRGVPGSRGDDYRAFARAVAADQNRPLVVINTIPGDPAVPASADSDELVEAGLALLNAGNISAAIPLFDHAAQIDPRHKEVWNDLGLAYLRSGKLDEAIVAFRKQLEIDPTDEHANDYLGLALKRQNRIAEAADALRKQVAINPLDAAAHAALGEILLAEQDYAQAAPELDKATILSPDNAELQVGLGRAYANTGERVKALAAFEKAAALSPTPLVWNDIAFDLADTKLDLDEAQHYADLAIDAIAADLRSVDARHPTPGQIRAVASLAACWDMLGWVHFQKGDFGVAERYIRAAWMLDQNGEIGDHLAQTYDKLGQKDRAIETYALALAAPHSIPETRARLTLLLGGNSQIDDLVAKAEPKLASIRARPAGKILDTDAHADFWIVFSRGGKAAHVDAVRFISGSDKLRALADRLRLLEFGEIFPDPKPVRLLRRGTLSCSAKTGDCTLILHRPEDVRTAD